MIALSPAKTRPDPGMRPLVSIIMANHCGASYLPHAIASVQAQTHPHWELLLCDDSSTDDSIAIVTVAAARDPRIRLLASAVNSGPSGARNRGLDAARGDWVAIVDSDDLMHPRRIEALLRAAEEYAVDMVADDMIFFGETPDVAGRTLLQSLKLVAPILVDPDILLASEDPGTRLPSFGYLKPMIRRSRIGALRYDPSLTIGEDFDFLLRFLLLQQWLLILPEGFYLYRRHPKSLSHRQSGPAIAAQLAAQGRLGDDLDPLQSRALGARLARRRAALEAGERFEALVAALKDGKPGAAFRQIASDPALILRLARSLAERVQRRLARRAAPREKPPLTLVLAEPGAEVAPGAMPPKTVPRLDVQPPRALSTSHARPPAALMARLSHLAACHRLTVLAVGTAGAEAAGYLPEGVEIRRLPSEPSRSVAPDAASHPLNAVPAGV